MPPNLRDFSVLTFDCYGTLIDWEQGIWDAFQPVLWKNDCSKIERDAALVAFGEIESEVEAAAPDLLYTDILTRVHERFAARFGLDSDPALDEAFGNSIPFWPAFPDSADALRRLKRDYKLVILSNVTRAGFEASNRRLGVTFDAIYTAEDIGTYKPEPPELPLHDGSSAGRARSIPRPDPPHRSESLPRPRTRGTRGSGPGLDRSPGAELRWRVGRDREGRGAPGGRFRFPLPGCAGRGCRTCRADELPADLRI